MITVYLIVKDLSTVIDDKIIPLINARNVKGTPLKIGDSFYDLRQLKISLEPEKGRGGFKKKDGVNYWFLPFEFSKDMVIQEGVEVLTSEQMTNYGWDSEEIEAL